MKFLEIIYFHVYNYFNDGPVPATSAICLMSISLSSWLLTIIGFATSSVIFMLLPVFVLVIIFCFYKFAPEKKHYHIYEKLKYSRWDNGTTKAFAWVFVVLGCASLPFFRFIVR
jgi:uncharacterized membrane protein YphA (DoxX/SURF4 family)